MASLLGASPPASHWPGLQAVLCKADHGRWREGHCRNPQQRQTVQKGDMGSHCESHCPHAPTPDTPLSATMQLPLPPRAPPSTFPQGLCTLTPFQLWGMQACGAGWHSQSFQGLLSSTGSAHSILMVMGPGDSKTGPVEVAECHRSC